MPESETRDDRSRAFTESADQRRRQCSRPLSALPIQTALKDHVGIIALDNYAKRNALSGEMIAAILASFAISRRGRFAW